MLIQKIDDEVQLRMFYEDDAEEFFNLIMESKSYLKNGLVGLIILKLLKILPNLLNLGILN